MLLLRTRAFLYQVNTENKRFMLGPMTPQLRRDARMLCDAGVLQMDGTFGLTREKVNVLFLVTIDDNGKGIILRVLLFALNPIALSASASYDSELLKELLDRWARQHLVTNL